MAQGGGSGLRSRSPLDAGIGSLKGQLETIVMITLDYWQWLPLCSYSSWRHQRKWYESDVEVQAEELKGWPLSGSINGLGGPVPALQQYGHMGGTPPAGIWWCGGGRLSRTSLWIQAFLLEQRSQITIWQHCSIPLPPCHPYIFYVQWLSTSVMRCPLLATWDFFPIGLPWFFFWHEAHQLRWLAPWD